MASLRASKYARYKRVTTFFLNWVLNARGRGRDTGQKVERKAMFFAADDEGQHSHQHFLSLLRGWLATLKGVEVQQQRVERESYYEVLELDEEYFPAFAEDLRLEVVYFFLELEELVEGVFEIYDQAKNEERTMVEATVAVKVAMDAASALTVCLQLKYPALKMAADVGFVLLNNLPGNFWRRANEAVVDFWKSFATDGTYKFVRTRILSRDMLTLTNDLVHNLSEMADALSQQQTEPVENAAIMFVMPFLDGLQRDGSVDMGALPGANRRMQVGSSAAMVIKSMCGKAVAVIKAKFPRAKVLHIPVLPNFATQEYGPGPIHKETQDQYDDGEEEEDNYELLSELMDVVGMSYG
ncbi:hypothetical protein PRIC2_003390 [Phytophthora ramorum]